MYTFVYLPNNLHFFLCHQIPRRIYQEISKEGKNTNTCHKLFCLSVYLAFRKMINCSIRLLENLPKLRFCQTYQPFDDQSNSFFLLVEGQQFYFYRNFISMNNGQVESNLWNVLVWELFKCTQCTIVFIQINFRLF